VSFALRLRPIRLVQGGGRRTFIRFKLIKLGEEPDRVEPAGCGVDGGGKGCRIDRSTQFSFSPRWSFDTYFRGTFTQVLGAAWLLTVARFGGLLMGGGKGRTVY